MSCSSPLSQFRLGFPCLQKPQSRQLPASRRDMAPMWNSCGGTLSKHIHNLFVFRGSLNDVENYFFRFESVTSPAKKVLKIALGNSLVIGSVRHLISNTRNTRKMPSFWLPQKITLPSRKSSSLGSENSRTRRRKFSALGYAA